MLVGSHLSGEKGGPPRPGPEKCQRIRPGQEAQADTSTCSSTGTGIDRFRIFCAIQKRRLFMYIDRFT
jgi:hypothetical protein